MSKTKKSVLFINTFTPVVPLYRDVFPLLIKNGVQPKAMISACQYRSCNDDEALSQWSMRLWVPNFVRKRRRWGAVLYWLVAPIIILMMRKQYIVFLTQPPLLYIVGAWIARLRGMSYCVHVMDLYPDLLFKEDIYRNNLIVKALNSMAGNVLCNADRVIVLGRCMRDVVLSKGVKPERISIVENWPEQSLAESDADGQLFRRQHGLIGKKVIMYSGNMGRFHRFDSILSVAARFKNHPDIVFVFIGHGVRRGEIDNMAKKSGNILVFDHQPDDRFGDILAAADLHFVSLRAGYEGLMVPSKFYSILASGRPVIYEGCSGGEIARVIAEEECGVVIEPGDMDSLEKSISDYASNPSKIAEEASRARRAYERRFERTTLAKRYVSVLLGA